MAMVVAPPGRVKQRGGRWACVRGGPLALTLATLPSYSFIYPWAIGPGAFACAV